MPLVLHPRGVNWFYEDLAERILGELARIGRRAVKSSGDEFLAAEPASLAEFDTVLILSLSEVLTSLDREQDRRLCLRKLWGFKRRILLSCDCIQSKWFSSQFAHSKGLITQVFDLSLSPQTPRPTVAGVPYTWVPEALTAAELDSLEENRGEREVPWALIGHMTGRRIGLVEDLIEHLGPHGFVFLPSLRPYNAGGRGLERVQLTRILRCTDLSVWCSHHDFPHHECLRSQAAVLAGALPVKIDPFHWRKFSTIPWVFGSTADLAERLRMDGWRLWTDAVRYFQRLGRLGTHLDEALAA